MDARTRFARVWVPGAMAVGALGALVTGALRFRPAPRLAQAPDGTSSRAVAPASSTPAVVPAPVGRVFQREYLRTGVLGGAASPDAFRRSLSGIAVGTRDHVFALGDDEVRVFDPQLRRIRTWPAPEHASCLAVGPDDRVYIGSAGRVDVYDAGGNHTAGFAAGNVDKPADVTAIAVFGADILVADAQARVIRRYDLDGTPLGIIGNQSKTGSFILPNRSLDLAVDPRGIVYATDSGRHQVTAWALDGTPRGRFGKFGMVAPEDFVGCCNPVNVAVTPEGNIVTGEKMVARVKMFDPEGTLLAVIGPEHFHPASIHIFLAVDSTGRILAADPVRRDVQVFSPRQTPHERPEP